MKQFIRHIFLLVAMLVATTNVWAECYVLNEQSEPHKITIYGSKSYDNISGPCATLSFQARRGVGIEGLEIYEYVNEERKNITKIKNGDLKTDFKTFSCNLSRNATKIEFYNTGGIWKEVKEVKITQATYLDAPTLNGSALQDNSIPFGEDIYGVEAYKDIKLNWSNIAALNCSFEQNDNSQFSAQVIDSDASTCTYGTATVRVTYARTNVNTHNATLVISSGSLSHTINLSGKTGEFTVLANNKIDLLMNSTYAPGDVFDVYYMKGDEKVIISDYTITPLNSQLADYVDGKIQTNYRTGNASFILSRIAKESCKALNETISVSVNQCEAICYLIENKSTSANHQTGQNEEGTYSEIYALNGMGDKLSFKCKLNRDPDFYHYLTPQYSTTDNGNDFQDFPDSKISTDNGNEHVCFGLNIPSGTKRIRFKRTAATAGTANFSIYEIYVARKKDFSVPKELTLPQTTIGKAVSASFDLNWSTCSDEIVLLSTNSNFVLGKSSIDATSGRGTTTITVTYDANSGSQLGTIFIYDQSQKIEISVSCEVKAKLTTEIIYTGNETYPNTPDGIPYPFYVKDENGNIVEGATIILETSNEDILSFDANKIYPHCGGSVTLTATYEGDATHVAASLSKTINVLDCNQKIIWDQDLRTYVATEEGVINETTLLAAVAANDEGEPTGTPIQYSLDAAAEEFADIVYNGDGTYSLRVHGIGKGVITASAVACTFEDEQYVAAQTIREIRVRKNGDPCDTYALEERNELYLEGWYNDTKVLPITGLPDSRMEFYAHVDRASVNNYFYVKFSTDNQATWSERQTFNIKETYDWSNPYVCTVPENSTHVHFETVSSLNTYFNCITIRQKTYITPSVNEIIINNAVVNQEFTYTFTVDYSDVPLIQYAITNNNNLNLKLTPSPEIHNDCGEHGKYTFTLTGTSLFPQTNVNETITIFTTAKHHIEIPITITSTLAETYYFQTADGNWSTPGNWTVNSQPATSLPTASNPVVITKNVTVDNQAVAYGVVMSQGAHIKIASTGGLTVHAGGYTPLNENEEDLEIIIDSVHAGYFRMSPIAETEMPKAIVHFTTRGQLNDGGNDAAYQYIGAPGDNAAMDISGTTVLYLRSEEKGWVRLKTFWAELEPFAGYALTQKEQPTFILYPKLLNGEKTIQLTYTEDGMKGDNLWANSYMAPLDITKFTPDDFTGNVIKTFYLYNSGSYDQWKNDTSSVSTAEVVSGRYYAIPVLAARALGAEAQTVIPPMQGVYMKAGEGGGEIKLSYEKHVWNNTQTAQMNKPLRIVGRNESAEEQIPDFQRVRLQVTSENSGADRMYIIQDSMATSGYDNGYDAEKLMAEGFMNIYTNEPFGKMEISSTNNMNEMYIGFQAGDDSQYTMTFSSLIGDSLYLYDMEADEYIEMTENGQYQFSATPMSTNDLRFQLLVAPDLPDNAPGQGGDVATTIENLSTTKLWISDKMVYVTNMQPNSTLAIYGLGGICVAQYQVPEGMKNIQYPISNLPVGIYIIRLNDQACKFVCK